jgi:hypothetical protein
MLDGRTIIEVRSTAGPRHDWRVWLVRFGSNGCKGRAVCQAVRNPYTRQWLAVGVSDGAIPFDGLRDVRRHFFRGNGRMTGGHAEITDAVSAPMSRLNVLALCAIRTAPGSGDYWS